MCNTCTCRNTCGCDGNGRGRNNCCVNLCAEFARAINNLFTDPCACRCTRCCGCNRQRNNCGCGCNRTADLSNFTDCGNYDAYYARQYGLCNRGSCCSL